MSLNWEFKDKEKFAAIKGETLNDAFIWEGNEMKTQIQRTPTFTASESYEERSNAKGAIILSPDGKQWGQFTERSCEDVSRTVGAHEELLTLIKTAYCIIAEAMPEQAPDPVAFVKVQKEWLKQTEQAISAETL